MKQNQYSGNEVPFRGFRGPLKESFGLWACISIVIGGIIGSGIFMKPASMAAQLGSPQLLIAVWIVAGIITLFGALSNAEVATMFPETGGQYIFFQKMYGDFFAFLYGWSAFAVFNTAGVASIAYVLGTYVEYFVHLPRFDPGMERSIDVFIPMIGHIFPLENIGVKGVTIGVVLLLSFINVRSAKLGGNLSIVITILKVLAIAVIIFGLLFSGAGNSDHLVQHSSVISPTGWKLLGALVAATSGAFWGYDGWNNISFVGGEISHPQKNIPKSLLLGILICILTYVVINIAFMYVLPIDAMATSSMVASDAMKIAFGTIGGGFIALIVILSTFGTTHTNVLASARVSFAMAADGQFFKSLSKVHPRYQTPSTAIWIHCLWTSLLVFSGSFDTLTDMLIFVSFLFYGMSALGIFILRKKLPDIERPYRVWGYPIVPAVFVLFALFFVIVTLFNDIHNYVSGTTVIINSLFGILLTCIGIPLYWYFNRIKKSFSQ